MRQVPIRSYSVINELLKKSGYVGPGITTAVSDHPLVSWLVTKALNFEDQFFPEASTRPLDSGIETDKELGDDDMLSKLLHANHHSVSHSIP